MQQPLSYDQLLKEIKRCNGNIQDHIELDLSLPRTSTAIARDFRVLNLTINSSDGSDHYACFGDGVHIENNLVIHRASSVVFGENLSVGGTIGIGRVYHLEFGAGLQVEDSINDGSRGRNESLILGPDTIIGSKYLSQGQWEDRKKWLRGGPWGQGMPYFHPSGLSEIPDNTTIMANVLLSKEVKIGDNVHIGGDLKWGAGETTSFVGKGLYVGGKMTLNIPQGGVFVIPRGSTIYQLDAQGGDQDVLLELEKDVHICILKATLENRLSPLNIPAGFWGKHFECILANNLRIIDPTADIEGDILIPGAQIQEWPLKHAYGKVDLAASTLQRFKYPRPMFEGDVRLDWTPINDLQQAIFMKDLYIPYCPNLDPQDLPGISIRGAIHHS